ncbi:uncharacterized protein BJ171DRAFT_583628 [Polychytrium aggregatum]|uniref:uncharacterized protein n=1 Tax=Polychytrium aggregatum TaxID=110093 RepID=UPI0022FE73E0|nr:uncharacterized protein BJ171DRAFT_583628 [Polychytrium aggregatum]KAI9202813.1 hypothetical protein BJ171DRAFT_583628 [Polychytrium aggregatum]
MNDTIEQIRQEYRASLADLTINSRPIITHLTIIARENAHAAPGIVQAIEAQIQNARPRFKLPALYLMDSICKNHPERYAELFSHNLARSFISSYEVMDLADREKMRRLFSTWRQPAKPIFPLNVLAQIDNYLRHSSSNGMPRGPQPPQDPRMVRDSAGTRFQPQGIHVNPHYMPGRHDNAPPSRHRDARPAPYPNPGFDARPNPNPRGAPPMPMPMPVPVPSPQNGPVDPMQMAWLPGQGALLQDISRLLETKQQYALMNPMDSLNNTQIQLLTELLRYVESAPLSPMAVADIAERLRQLNLMDVRPGASTMVPAPDSMPVPIPGPGPVPVPAPAPMPIPMPVPAPVPVAIPAPTPSWAPNSARNRPVLTSDQLPKLDLRSEVIAQRIPGAADIIYDALELQCKQCGLRYPRNPASKEKMDLHLDWHFRQNRRAKEKGKKSVSRDWYLGEQDWLDERDVPIKTNVQSFFFPTEKQEDVKPEEIVNIPALGDDEFCTVCKEKLEKVWDDEQELWMLKDAMRKDDKVYHPSCFHEAASSSGSRTPPPEPIATGASSTTANAADIGPAKKRKLEDEADPSSRKSPMLGQAPGGAASFSGAESTPLVPNLAGLSSLLAGLEPSSAPASTAVMTSITTDQ